MDLKDYVTIGEDGKPVFDNQKFTSDLDKERTSASETARKNYDSKTRVEVEKEIRTKVEEEAKLSAEEKLKKEREDFTAKVIAWNKNALKKKYLSANYTEEEAELLSSLCGEDYEQSEISANKLIETRMKANEDYKKQLLADIQSKQGVPDGQGDNKAEKNSDAIKRAKAFNEKATSVKEVTL